MDGGAAHELDALVDLRLEPDVFEHSRHSPPRQEMASPPVPGELLVDIFLRLPDPADLIRASAACVSFRRLVADRSFLRQYRKIQGPPFLGLLDVGKVFHPPEPPHPSAQAASAAALDADFSLSFLPGSARDWLVHDIRDSRVLLHRFCRHGTSDMVVCDPLHRRYLLLPPITSDLLASAEDPLWTKMQLHAQIFLIPPSPSDSEDAATAADGTSFRVIWMAWSKTRLAASVFSSNTGQWRAVPSRRWVDLSPDLSQFTERVGLYSHHYVHGCSYWTTEDCSESKLLMLDTETMEFSIVEPPPEAKGYWGLAMVEAGEGRPGLFVLKDAADGALDLCYTIRQTDGGSSGQWQKVNTITLCSGSFLMCSTDKYLFLYQPQGPLLEAGCFALDIGTFQLERVCGLGSTIQTTRAYRNFPPSLLSSPTISSGVENRAEKEMLEQGCVACSSAESPRSD